MTAYVFVLGLTALTSAGCLGLAWKASRKWEPDAYVWRDGQGHEYGTMGEAWIDAQKRGRR